MPSERDGRNGRAERPPPERGESRSRDADGETNPDADEDGDRADGVLGRTRAFARRTGRRVRAAPRAWAAYTVWVTLVCVAHFGGLHYRVYWEVWWWDILTHGTSGAGVAALFPLLGLAAWHRRSLTSRLLLAAGVVGVVGVGFEVYERLFRTFWHEWTLAYYLEDTAVDIVVDALGAAAFVALAAGWRALGRPGVDRRTSSARTSPGTGTGTGTGTRTNASAGASVSTDHDPGAD